MAPKGSKRTSNKVPNSPAKKQKSDPACAGVAEAIELAVELPDNCRKMLVACVPGSLGVRQDERHETQAAMAKMISGVVYGVQSKMQEDLDAENAKVADFEARKADREAAVAQAVSAISVASQRTQSMGTALAEACEAMQASEAALKTSQAAQEAGDAAMVKAKEIMAEIQKGIDGPLFAIMNGDSEDPEQHYNALRSLFQYLAMDDSLLSALPSSCKKKLPDRGPFDSMVLSQFDTQMKEKAAALAKEVDDEAPGAQERAAAVAAAQEEVGHRAAKRKEAEDAKAAAMEEERLAREAHKAAEEALAAYGPEFAEATRLRDEKVQKISNFKLYNVMCLELLRERASPEAAAGEAEAKEAAAEAA